MKGGGRVVNIYEVHEALLLNGFIGLVTETRKDGRNAASP